MLRMLPKQVVNQRECLWRVFCAKTMTHLVNYNNMIQLIKAATLVNNHELQRNAQSMILKIRSEEPEKFFIQNVQILQSIDLPTPIRQAAGTLLAVSLKQKNPDQSFLWDRLSPAGKSSFKDMVINTMIDKQKVIRRAAANIVAAICCIEIPRKQWEGIAEKITSNINNEDLIVKEVSILTIGFICEQLKQFNFEFDEPLQETILTGILLGVKDKHNQIAETAFKALRDGISSVSSLMKNSQYREYLIKQIAEAITNKNFAELGLQCLNEFIKHNFSYMTATYVEGFANIIDPILRNPKNEGTCILAMDFWATLAREEKSIEQNPNQIRFIAGAFADRLVESLLQNLCQVEEDEQEENGISDAAGSALEAIFEGDSTQYQTKVLTFTSNTINHQNWKYRQGSIRAFAILLLGLPDELAQQYVNESLLGLVKLLNDPKPFVQLSAIKSLSLISEETGRVILLHSNFVQILQLIVSKSSINQTFMRHCCKIIDSLCMVEKSVNFIGPLSDDLIKFLLDCCLEPARSVSSLNNCFCTILNLISNSLSTTIANKYIEYVLAHFGKISGLTAEKKEAFYGGFYTLAQVCLMTIRKAGGSITVDQLSKLYELVVGYYKQISNVEADGFYVVSALAYFFPQDRRIVDDFWPYVQFGLKKINQSEVFKAAISCVCDFATTYGGAISDKVDSILNELLENFEKNLVTRELKLDILMCIGELFLQCANSCQKHIKRVMDIILISIEGVFHVTDTNYAEVLQESIVETLMCIYHGLNSEWNNRQLADYISYIFQFMTITTDKARRPKLDYVKQTMILLADIVGFYPNESLNIVQHQYVVDRLETLKRYNNDGHLTRNISYIKERFKL